jgi:hypothetical protein
MVDHFRKYYHFISLAHLYSTESVAQVFFAKVVRLHGVPQSTVSDRDPVFMSIFWRELLRLTRSKHAMLSAIHPQSNEQTGAANKVIVMYLRCLTGDRPHQWLRRLPWPKYIYNIVFQNSPEGHFVQDHLRPRPTHHPLI